MKLRPYQEAAVAAIIEKLKTDRATLLVMPPGCGKTQVFVALAGQLGLRTLVLAHTDELVNQAATRIEDMLGTAPAIEKANSRAKRNAPYVVASVQSLHPARLATWPRDHFGLVVVDESQHSPATTYQQILNHFEPARVVGVTATPDRLDGQGLDVVFDSVAFEYTLPEAIRDGWLVRVLAQRIKLREVDLGGITVRAGDLATNELEARIGQQKVLEAIAKALFEYGEGRKTLVFTPMVDSACRLADILNDTQADCARVVHGGTPIEERREILHGHAAGDFRFVVSVNVLGEGFDSPSVSCVAMARPTKSRARYIQNLGRGLRLFPGKQNCLVLDFTGATRRHDLIGPEDALAGKEIDEETREEFDRMLTEEFEHGLDLEDTIQKAHERVVCEAQRQRDLLAEQERVRQERKAAREQELRDQVAERARRLADQEAQRLEREEEIERKRAERRIFGRSDGHPYEPAPPPTASRKPMTKRPADWPKVWPPHPRRLSLDQGYMRQLVLTADKMILDEHLWELLGGSPEAWDAAFARGGPEAPLNIINELREEHKVVTSTGLPAMAAARLLDRLDARKSARLVSPRQLYFVVRERLGGPATTTKNASKRLSVRWGKLPAEECPEAVEGYWEKVEKAQQQERERERARQAEAAQLPNDEVPKHDDWLQQFIDTPPAPPDENEESERDEAPVHDDWLQQFIDGAVAKKESEAPEHDDWLQQFIDAPPARRDDDKWQEEQEESET